MEKRTILVVDDDQDLLGAIVIRLRASGYEVISAADAIQATGLARRSRPDVILLDIGLPGGDGFLVLERLKINQVTATIPVIVLTGRDPASNRRRAEESGAFAFHQKPVDNKALLSSISEALGEPSTEDLQRRS